MSGIPREPWFPVRRAVSKDRAVLVVARLTEIPRQLVTGWLIELWGWVDQEMDNDLCPGIWVEDLLRAVGYPEEGYPALESCKHVGLQCSAPSALDRFASALQEAGLMRNLTDEADLGTRTLCIPQFDKWFSQSAKRRMKQAQHVTDHRIRTSPRPSRSSSAASAEVRASCKHSTSPQDRTGQNRRTPGGSPSRDESLARAKGYGRDLPEELRVDWESFLDHTFAKKIPTEGAIQRWLDFAQRLVQDRNVEAARELLVGTITANAQGIPVWAFKKATKGEPSRGDTVSVRARNRAIREGAGGSQ